MMSETITKPKTEKFLFGQNNFDEPEEPEELEDEIPEPTFSEAELQAACNQSADEAFAKGKKEGMDETHASYEAQIAKALQELAAKLPPLLQQESERIKLYEQESVKLCLSLFQKLFPRLQEEFGFDELESILKTVLQEQHGQNNVIIHVSPELVSGLQERLENGFKNNAEHANYKIEGQEGLTSGAFHLSWSDGGAIRDSDTMATEVVRLMEEALAQGLSKGHDGKEIIASAPAQEAEIQAAPVREETKIKDAEEAGANAEEAGANAEEAGANAEEAGAEEANAEESTTEEDIKQEKPDE